MHSDALIIGGGQAGLAAAYELQQRGRDALILEANAALGDNWRQRWGGLRLFTPNRYNALPGSPFPGEAYGLPDRRQVADYLEAYAKTHDLASELNADVVSLRRDATSGLFAVGIADGRTFEAPSVVVATGAYRTPRLPGFAERLPPDFPQRHTSQLRDLSQWPGPEASRVLVVGAGASGTQVAVHLRARHEVVLAGRDPGALPRRLAGRDIYDYLYGLGLMDLRTTTFPGRYLKGKPGAGEIGVGDHADAAAERLGIGRCGRIRDYREGIFHTADAERIEDVAAVVFATGYRNTYPFIEVGGALSPEGAPVHDRGVSPVRGLYWMGLPMMRRIGSSLLGGVGADARFIAEAIARPAGTTANSLARSKA